MLYYNATFGVYDGNIPMPGDAAATVEQISAHVAARKPNRAQRVAALFAPYNISRVTAQMVLGMGELEAKLRAATQTEPEPISYEDALADTATRNRTYQVCRALEDAALLIDKEPTP